MSKFNEAEEILNRFRRMLLQNPNLQLDYKTIYWELAKYNSNVQKEDFVRDNCFAQWIRNFRESKNMQVFVAENWNHFCQFNHHKFPMDSNYLKLYINLNESHIYEGVNKIFSFLESENIVHHSKVAATLRSDGLVIRLKGNDIESAKKICAFIQNEPYIRYGANQPNPFIPNIGCVGIMKDDGNSYNGDLSKVIAAYLQTIDLSKPIKLQDFIKYATTTFVKSGMPLWAQNLISAYDSKFTLDSLQEQREILDGNVNNLIDFAIIETYNKYGKNHSIKAILEALAGNFNYFPRESLDGKKEIRRELMDKVSADDIKRYIAKLVNVKDLIDVNIVISFFDKILYKNKGVIFDNALKVTIDKYKNNYASVLTRIERYMYENHAEEFTSYGLDPEKKFNYRQSVIDNIKPIQVMDVIKSILESKGIDYTKMNNNQILDEYAIGILKELGLSTSRN